MSRLYVLATPLGNLEDMSPRAKRLLVECHLILAEDTRVTRKLLNAFSIAAPLESCHGHNEAQKAAGLIQRMLAENLTVCLVSDAGTPSVSDPGARLVAAAHAAGVEVLAVPGPSAQAAALSVSGFTEDEFTFYGFLPRKKGELDAKLKSMQGKAKLAVLYESPHRVISLLEAVKRVYPKARMSVSRELSKLHEQTLTGTVEELLQRFADDERLLCRGEFCLLLQVPEIVHEEQGTPTPSQSLEGRLMEALLQGDSLRDAMDSLVQAGERKNQVYAASLRLRQVAEKLLVKDQQSL